MEDFDHINIEYYDNILSQPNNSDTNTDLNQSQYSENAQSTIQYNEFIITNNMQQIFENVSENIQNNNYVFIQYDVNNQNFKKKRGRKRKVRPNYNLSLSASSSHISNTYTQSSDEFNFYSQDYSNNTNYDQTNNYVMEISNRGNNLYNSTFDVQSFNNENMSANENLNMELISNNNNNDINNNFNLENILNNEMGVKSRVIDNDIQPSNITQTQENNVINEDIVVPLQENEENIILQTNKVLYDKFVLFYYKNESELINHCKHYLKKFVEDYFPLNVKFYKDDIEYSMNLTSINFKDDFFEIIVNNDITLIDYINYNFKSNYDMENIMLNIYYKTNINDKKSLNVLFTESCFNYKSLPASHPSLKLENGNIVVYEETRSLLPFK